MKIYSLCEEPGTKYVDLYGKLLPPRAIETELSSFELNDIELID